MPGQMIQVQSVLTTSYVSLLELKMTLRFMFNIYGGLNEKQRCDKCNSG